MFIVYLLGKNKSHNQCRGARYVLLNDAAIAVQPEQLSLDLLRVLSFSLLIYSEGGLALSIYTSTLIDGVLICGNVCARVQSTLWTNLY